MEIGDLIEEIISNLLELNNMDIDQVSRLMGGVLLKEIRKIEAFDSTVPDEVKKLSPFCRAGNKYPMLDKVLKRIPPHRKYVEPFVGSGVVFFAKDKAGQTVINDLDEDLIRAYRSLKAFKGRDMER